MLTNKNWAPKAFSTIRWVFAVCTAFFLVGCQPPGPKSLLLGEKYLEQGDYKKALKYLTRASELIPEHPQVWNHLGLAYHGVNQPAKAVEAYQRALRIDRNLPAPRYNLGVLLLEQDHLPQAVAELNAFLTLQKDSATGWTKLGTALVRMQRPDEAEQALTQALRLNPKEPEAHNSLGLAHIQRKRPREAMLAFNNALQFREGYPAALLNQAIIAHQHFGNKELALERYKAFLSTKPDVKSATQVQQTIASLEREIAGVQVAEAPAPEPETTNAFSAFLRTNVALKTAEVVTNRAAPPRHTNVAVRAVPAKTNTPVSTNVQAVAAAATNTPNREVTNTVAAVVTNAPASPKTNAVVVAKADKTDVEPDTADKKTADNKTGDQKLAAREPADEQPAENEPVEPPLEVEVVTVQSAPEFKPIDDVPAKPIAATTTAPAESSEPKPLIIPRRERKEEEKPGFLSRVNPVRWFRDDDKEDAKVDKSDMQLMARQATPPPARPSYPPVTKVTDPKPEPPRVIARYQYRKNIPLKSGNRSAAKKVFEQGAEAHQARRLADAMEAYQNASALDPSFFDAHYNLGVAAFQSKNIPLALAASELAVAAKPDSEEARFNFALTLREANHPVDAANELKTLLADHPEESRAHFVLANIYAQLLDQPAMARKHYLAVLELTPNHPEAPAIRSWLASNE